MGLFQTISNAEFVMRLKFTMTTSTHIFAQTVTSGMRSRAQTPTAFTARVARNGL
jgi:hypothetical protein